jgi:DeoR/GlpR family transcriptional regulator of sugar metabolism
MYDFIKNKNIIVVTNNALILKKVLNSKAKFVMVGGDYLPHYNMVVGTFAIKQISNYAYDHCFVGCTGINFDTGFAYTVEQETKDIKIEAMRNSSHNYLLVDSSKINIKAFIKITELNSFDKIFISNVELIKKDNNIILV